MLVSDLGWCVWPMLTAATVCGAAGGTPGRSTSPWRMTSGSRWTWSMSMTTSTSSQRLEAAHYSSRRLAECSVDQLSQWKRCMTSCQELFTISQTWENPWLQILRFKKNILSFNFFLLCLWAFHQRTAWMSPMLTVSGWMTPATQSRSTHCRVFRSGEGLMFPATIRRAYTTLTC